MQVKYRCSPQAPGPTLMPPRHVLQTARAWARTVKHRGPATTPSPVPLPLGHASHESAYTTNEALLRKVESPLALFDGHEELPSQIIDVAVVGQFQVVDARHDAREVVVRRVWCLAGLANHGEHGGQASEA